MLDAPWLAPRSIESLDDDWDTTAPRAPGIYIVSLGHLVRRIGGTDRQGILYIGKAHRLRMRVWQFWKCNHTATGFLWTHLNVAEIILRQPIRNGGQLIDRLGQLGIRVSTPIRSRVLDRAERAVMRAYVDRFGESPPLNLSLPGDGLEVPSIPSDLRWARRGLIVGRA